MIRGVTRLERAVGPLGACLLALLATLAVAPRVGDVINGAGALHRSSQAITYRNEVLLGQYVSFVIAMAFTGILVFAWLVLERRLARLPGRKAARIARFALAAVALAWAVHVSFAAGVAAVLLGLLGITYVAAHSASGLARPRPTSERALASMVVAAEAIAAGWATWVSLAPRDSTLTSGVIAVGIALFAGWRIGRGAKPDGVRALRFDAIAGAPFLVLAASALFRAPTPRLLLAAAIIAGALRWAVQRFWAPSELPRGLAPVAALWALAAIAIVPVGMRELPSVNWGGHEGMHYAWVNSALHGKLLMADAGLNHGPLRDYLVSLFALITGPTTEHVRMAAVLVNLVGMAFLLPIGWRVVNGQMWLQAWYAYLLVAHTPARMIVDYRYRISLGWADLSRTAWSTLAVVGGVTALTRASVSRRSIFGWGVAAGLALLYSQEFGACAAAAVLVALGCDRLLRGEGSAWRRIVRTARDALPYLGGVLAPLLLITAIYATRGRGGLFLKSLYESVAGAAAGVWGSIPMPFTRDTFATPYEFVKAFISGEADARYHDATIEFMLPGAIYLLTTVVLLVTVMRRRWSARSTSLLALLVFGVGAYRVSLGAADIWHLLSTTTPALLLTVALSADAVRFKLRLDGRRAVPLGAVAVAFIAALTVAMGERAGCVTKKLAMLDSGEEKLSPKTPLAYEGLPRAGDLYIEPSVVAMAMYIRKNTQARDPIFVMQEMFVGAELYWLADRRNSTRFDTLQEITTLDRQKETLASLERDPPELVIGSNGEYTGEAVVAYVREHFASVKDAPAGYEVRRRIIPVTSPP